MEKLLAPIETRLDGVCYLGDTEPVSSCLRFYQFYNKRQREHSWKQGTETGLSLGKQVIETLMITILEVERT